TDRSGSVDFMSTSAEDLRAIALTEFATAGFAGTSLHRIADLAGLSKSSVLYHFASKDALLEAAVSPAIKRMHEILESMASRPVTKASRREFIADFVDFLLEHRLEVHLFINQGPSLVDVPVIDQANELVQHLADFFASTAMTTEHRMRFGVALGGAAYMLVTQQAMAMDAAPEDETRAALITILTELLAPVPVSTHLE
ncbi:MAG: TetR/AcrR family transcriptional regulator, partial [Terrimesophilobacter sp.]